MVRLMSNVRSGAGRALLALLSVALLALCAAIFVANAPSAEAQSPPDPSGQVCPPHIPPFPAVPCFDLDDKTGSTPIDDDSRNTLNEINENLRRERGGNWGQPSITPGPGAIESIDAPANLSVTPGEGYLDIAWDAVSGATGYDVQAQTAGSSSWHDVAGNVTGTSHRYTTSATIDHVRVRARNTSGAGNWSQVSRLPAADWLNTVQSAGAASASSAGGGIASQLTAPTWGTISRYYDASRRSDRIDVNWTGDTDSTGYNLVCAVGGGSSAGWNWHPCGWIDEATGTVTYTTVPANASQPVGIVSYKREAGSGLPPGIIPLDEVRSYGVAIRSVSATPSEASAWVASASIRPLHPQLSNLTHTRGDGQITLRWTPNPWTTGYEIDCDTYDSTQSPHSPSYTRCATLTNQDHSASEHNVTISTWTAGGTNYAIDNTSTYDIRICSTNATGYGCHLAPLISPNTALTVSNFTVTTATLTIAHHSGDWYYKHTNTGATCDGPVSGTSKDLTGLTANTTYTYSAYSDSGCTSGNLLAAASPFTTLSSVSNLTSTKHTSFESQIHNALSAAVAFTTGSNASGYVLKSVTVPLKNTGGTSGVIFQLRGMEGTGQYSSTSQPSDASLSTLTTATPTASTYTDTTVTCSGSGCGLSPDTTYFIVASALDAALAYSWAVSTSEIETAQPSGNGWSVGFGHYKTGDRNTIWGSYDDWNIAEIGFVNAPGLTSSGVTATTATLTIGNHHDAWYYKATSGPHTACQGPVAAGTSSASLTGLSAGTSYTYSAYSDSGCTNANLLATAAAFTTPQQVVSVSNLSETTATNAHVLDTAIAQEFKTGANTGGYTLSSVQVEFEFVLNAGAVTVTLRERLANGQPATTVLATLSGTAAAGAATFTCSSSCDLSASTSYFVYAAASSTGAAYARLTDRDTEALTPAGNGWSIANASRYQQGLWGEFPGGLSMKIKVTATEK